ncbi:MAG: hypothetical protein WD056_02015 [Gemmatimonadota bacterium]
MTPAGLRSPPNPTPPRAFVGQERRVWWIGLTLSALFHLVLLLLYPAFTGDLDLRVPIDDSDPDTPLIEGMELVVLLELEETNPEPIVEPLPAVPAPSEPVEVEPDAVVTAVEDEPGAVSDEVIAEDPEEEGLTLAERLQPRLGDPRVWAPIPSQFTELTEFERAEILLRGMLQDWNDSMAVAQALADRAGDWTYTDASGRRWGLGPGRLYLGDISIPLPAFEFAPGLIEDTLDEQSLRAELARGAESEALRETWSDRARVIRERMEQERSPAGSPADEGAGG